MLGTSSSFPFSLGQTPQVPSSTWWFLMWCLGIASCSLSSAWITVLPYQRKDRVNRCFWKPARLRRLHCSQFSVSLAAFSRFHSELVDTSAGMVRWYTCLDPSKQQYTQKDPLHRNNLAPGQLTFQLSKETGPFMFKIYNSDTYGWHESHSPSHKSNGRYQVTAYSKRFWMWGVVSLPSTQITYVED